MALLDLDKKICEEYGIKGEVDAELISKNSFVKTQMNEIRNALWRARVDYIISVQILDAQRKAGAEDTLSQYEAKVAEQKNMIKNFSRSVKTLLELAAELDGAN